MLGYFTTGSKIIYDKTTDLILYYTGYNKNDDNFNELYNIENVNNNFRMYPSLSFFESYNSFKNDPTLIIDNLYLGSAYNAGSYDLLKKLEINVIINVTAEISNYYPNDFTYYKYDLYDDNKSSVCKYLDESLNTIRYHQDNTTGNILVHCFMGASRSVSIVLHYIMNTMTNDKGEYYSVEEALEFIKNKRSVINPTIKLISDIKTCNEKKIDL